MSADKAVHAFICFVSLCLQIFVSLCTFSIITRQECIRGLILLLSLKNIVNLNDIINLLTHVIHYIYIHALSLQSDLRHQAMEGKTKAKYIW